MQINLKYAIELTKKFVDYLSDELLTMLVNF